ncbi:hypothetical protein KW791_02075 [Candidatus Parcubacteria bacterium]|nr:hypothetical protein [Candidatus Parcubacteria bacterium]
MMLYVHHFLVALLLTVVAETLIVAVFIFKIYRLKLKNIIATSIVVNVLTLPYVWFVFPFLTSRTSALVIAEIFAWVVEAILYKIFLKLSFKQALIVSFVANLASYLLGLAL